MGAKKEEKKKTRTPIFLKTFVNRQTGRGHSCIFAAAKPNNTDNCCILMRDTPLATAGPSSEPLLSVAPATAGPQRAHVSLCPFSPLPTQHAKRGLPTGLIWECFSPRGSVEYGLPRRVNTILYASVLKKLLLL